MALKRNPSMALCAVEPAKRSKATPNVLQPWEPLNLHLSPRIPSDRAALLAERLRADPKLRLVDSEDGALLVLPSFEFEELSALQKRGKRVVGLPLVERFLKERSLMEKVMELPLFDLLYRSEKGLCFSAMNPEDRSRHQAFATWVGARVTEDIGPDTELLVARKVSLRPDSKYQAALALRLPIVRPTYVKALWDEQQLVDKEPHFLPPLAGLAINFGPIQDQVSPELRKRAEASGAVITTLDKAEVVIVTDASKPIYQEGRSLGLLCAPPLWLERCLQIRCCLTIAGELEVPQAGVPLGGSVEAEVSNILHGCVLCLVYLPPGKERDDAAERAWRCGAWTTLEAKDPSITHVLFDVVPRVLVHVSMPIDEALGVEFVDVRWLDECVATGKRAEENNFARPRVAYNPTCDVAYPAALQSDLSTPTMKVRRVESSAALEEVTTKSTQLVEAAAGKPELRSGQKPPLSGLTVRITALDDSKQSCRERQRLQEMAHSLGATVADQRSRLGDITHFVCVVPDRLEAGLAEKARKRQIHIVAVHWLLDCNRHGSRQPEARYSVRDAAPVPTQSAAPLLEDAVTKASPCVAATVLAKCDILVSPWALGVEPKLTQMAKELGATSVRTWRTPAELRSLLQASSEGQTRAVVVEKDEARQGSLEGCIENWTPELRSIFVQPSWLSAAWQHVECRVGSVFGACGYGCCFVALTSLSSYCRECWAPAGDVVSHILSFFCRAVLCVVSIKINEVYH
ncbi:topbp1-A [Symbiodinium sp. CCMP2592]|nr:topbp1-A [Symbiodinium sp. CCMP2592]